MKPINVNLNKKPVKVGDRTYTYWVLRWVDLRGKSHMEQVGRADGPKKLPKRQARLIQSRREQEINRNPHMRSGIRAETLSQFLEGYLESRVSELSPGALVLHAQTARYLRGFFTSDPPIDKVSKADARGFKTALAAGRLTHISQRPQMLSPATVDGHMRNARTMFNRALEDSIIQDNPFKHMCESRPVARDWHYVVSKELHRLVEAAPAIDWRVLFSLCRLAALRRAEALNLEWSNVDFERNTIQIISKQHWRTKTRRARVIPMCSQLQVVLTEAFHEASPGSKRVINSIVVKNIWRDFHVIRQRAKVDKYPEPFHAMRKSCAQDWARLNVGPKSLHVWMGHTGFETTMEYYLKVPQSEYDRVTETAFLVPPVEKNVEKNKKRS